MGQPTAASMNALERRNAMVKQARELGIAKPHTMKNAELEEAIAGVLKARQDIKDIKEAEGDPFDEIDPSLEGDHLEEETVADKLAERAATREAWLLSAVDQLIPLLEQAGCQNLRTRNISISVGFPARNIRKTIGQCWATRASEGGKTSHLFISPLLDDAVKVLGVALHELIHCDDDCVSQHAGHFRKVATTVGLTGKMTATEVGEDLAPVLKGIADDLGPYPHIKLNLGGGVIKTQTTRMLKVECLDAECPYLEDGKGYTVRTSKKWLEVGLPNCPCGATMTVGE